MVEDKNIINCDEDIIAVMSKDLGIEQFCDEPLLSFRRRVIYSGLASWIKVSTLDKSTYGKIDNCSGVSRRHISDKCSRVLNSFLKMYPDLHDWFYAEDCSLDPINILRNRLICHGDLLNEGFNTNLALTSVESNVVADNIEVVLGEIINENYSYAGISMVKTSGEECGTNRVPQYDSVSWMKDYLNNAWWEKCSKQMDGLFFFNPFEKSKNNYSLWQESIVREIEGVVLARRSINVNSYEYYILKPQKNEIHKIDPFLVDFGEHIRFMIAMRKMVNNPVYMNIYKLDENYFELCLNVLLPKSELSELESYAWPIQRIDDKREWIIRNELWPYFKNRLEMLGIEVR